MTRFTKDPVLKKEEESVDNFIIGKEHYPNSDPWENLDDKRRRPHINLMMTDAEIAKLDFIISKTPYSKTRFCLAVILPEIDKKIEEIKRLGI